jgi:ribosome biogenesis SPOUT family RNA methylase Rps3
MTNSAMSNPKVYIVEHLDPELEEWSALEYSTIAQECHDAGASFYLSSVSPDLVVPKNLKNAIGLQVEQRGVEELFADKKQEVCLLDPSAETELSPEDAETFAVFLFGGILGT